MTEEWQAALRLQLTPGLGLRRAKALVQHLGGCQQALHAGDGILRDALGPRLWSALRALPADLTDALARVRQWLDSAPDGQSHRVRVWGQAHYPQALLDLPDPPLLLFVTGPQHEADVDWPPSVALVGSRGATPQGLTLALEWGQALADAGWCVVSGLAHGIDAAAHAGALRSARSACLTMAVMGTGPDRVYPPSHAALKSRICERGRCVTEFLPGIPARRAHFPLRNRLVSALSSGLVVIEAGTGSGSLISAQCALEQGKEVMAVPGSVRSPLSRGCHALLRQGATLVEQVEDVLAALPVRMPLVPVPSTPCPVAAPDDPDALALRRALAHDPVAVDELQRRLGLDMGTLQARLLTLEMQGRLARLAGDRVQWLGD
ncbi:MAG: DNA-protecting protein DprA [Pseudomonadota bacterium]|jgi:DNA processing protein